MTIFFSRRPTNTDQHRQSERISLSSFCSKAHRMKHRRSVIHLRVDLSFKLLSKLRLTTIIYNHNHNHNHNHTTTTTTTTTNTFYPIPIGKACYGIIRINIMFNLFFFLFLLVIVIYIREPRQSQVTFQYFGALVILRSQSNCVSTCTAVSSH
jgi:hypothetical protein